MAELKTRKNDASVEDFLNSVPDERKREDSLAILELMREVTGEEPALWGTSIVGLHNKLSSESVIAPALEITTSAIA